MGTESGKADANAPRPMGGPWGLKITGVGAALPEKVLTNVDLTAWMDTSDEWIRERTGIGEPNWQKNLTRKKEACYLI